MKKFSVTKCQSSGRRSGGARRENRNLAQTETASARRPVSNVGERISVGT